MFAWIFRSPETNTNFGIPQSLYPDKYSVFFVNPKKKFDLSIEEQLNGITKRITQFGRIIQDLGIDMFPAHSPQAKGRIERLWETLQSRLPVEFAMRNINDMERANIFLKEYIHSFNAQFAVHMYLYLKPAILIGCFVLNIRENYLRVQQYH